MKKNPNLITVVVFCGLVGSLALANLFAPKRAYSENENRYLAQMPELTADHLFSGAFGADFESYLSDQFIGRDAWMVLGTETKRALGNREIGGVFLGKDGYYIQNTDLSDEAQFKSNVEAVRTFFDRHAGSIPKERMTFLLAPTAASVLQDRLPAFAPVPDEDTFLDTAFRALSGYCTVDVRQTLTAHKQEGIYYKTDHHWTTKGAFLSYQAYCAAQGNTIPQESDYRIETVSKTFRGSLYSKVLAHDAAYDSISLYHWKRPQNVLYKSGAFTREGCYDRAALDQKDKYLVFFGENNAEATLTTDAGTGRRLLVVKDSYANAFVPFLTAQYDSIHMLDLRYYKASVDQYMAQNGITDVLVLYNISNFVSDSNLPKLNAMHPTATGTK